jgi:acyl-CoA synthetase (AMP-forming)/AMP-acid ligase II
VGTDGKEVPQGSIMSVFGKEKVEEHDLAKLSKHINVLGKYWKETTQGRIAIYLPNNIEYLVAIFGKWIAVEIVDIPLTHHSLRFLRSDANPPPSQPARREGPRTPQSGRC